MKHQNYSTKKERWLFFIVFGFFVVLVAVGSLNNFMPKVAYTTYGYFVKKDALFGEDYDGTHVSVKLLFRLDDDSVVEIPANTTDAINVNSYPEGAKAIIHYRKGIFTKNRIYDSYEILE